MTPPAEASDFLDHCSNSGFSGHACGNPPLYVPKAPAEPEVIGEYISKESAFSAESPDLAFEANLGHFTGRRFARPNRQYPVVKGPKEGPAKYGHCIEL
jgi:hypothetical protein